jgi:hypothetical protein
MAVEFVVEDGSGKTDATSYMSTTDMDQYWENKGYDAFTGTTEAKEQLLNQATSIVDGQYSNRFDGNRTSRDQALQWPREKAYYPDGWEIASNSIPKEMPNAIAEMAYAINSGTDPQPIETDLGNVKRKSDKVDVITTSREYFDTRSHPKISAVEDALRPLLGNVGSYGGRNLVRV